MGALHVHIRPEKDTAWLRDKVTGTLSRCLRAAQRHPRVCPDGSEGGPFLWNQASHDMNGLALFQRG